MNLLIVEDGKETLEFLEESFKEEGFWVDTAADGEVGFCKAKTNKYDVIILDNSLPKKNGQDVCFELRKEGITTPIIMLSVGSETDIKVSVLNAGADDYLTKPFSFEELLARVHALARRPTEIKHTILKIKDLILDLDNRTLKINEKEIHLTPKEFSLLEYLIKNKGRVVSRGEILEHVWDVDADPFTNTVETHIVNLRKKIGEANKKLIHTVTGTGYVVE